MKPPRHYGAPRGDGAYDRALYSQPGDPIRQGRVTPPADSSLLRFEDGNGTCLALLGVIVVGQITPDPAGEYLWSCFLPMTPRQQRAGDLDKAQGALAFKVREWCAAAGVVVSAAAMARLRGGA
jgi:hypothetical protein